MIASLPIYVHKQTDDNSSCIECAVCLPCFTCPIRRTEADPGRTTNSAGVDVTAGQPSSNSAVVTTRFMAYVSSSIYQLGLWLMFPDTQ
ncbi:hypothetical protein MKW98_006304 [Papaver atlanticum]|uniref:Uncharacterized protein n=1 Tax=Papaver atlanticum TaxID=357466 RepID=A0AAD4XWW9_9MAGN|nr:hypothetical protein MKW98_006304 [Papaver atlanticum]